MGIRTYSFCCDSCSYEFCQEVDWNLIQKYKPECPQCNSKKVFRDYNSDRVIFDDGVPKTIGMLADRHAKEKKIDFK